MSRTINKQLDAAIQATRQEDYLRAYTQFVELYGSDDLASIGSPKAATGLSFFGLCLVLVQKKVKPALDLCKRAIELEFYNGDHYVNLTKVYIAAGNRKKAVEAVEGGLKHLPDHEGLMNLRKEMGVRARPAVPFLTRNHPINVALGQKREARKESAKAAKK